MIEHAETPVGVINLDRVRTNARSVVDYAAAHDLKWRPHIKTHKSVEIAALQLQAGAQGLTVATPHEAEVMATVCSDLLLAYPPVGATKVRRLMELDESVKLSVGLDSEAALRPLAAAAHDSGRTVDVLIEFDAGAKRVGVPTPADAVVLAQLAGELPGVRPTGLMFYPGHIRIARGEQGDLLGKLAATVTAFVEALAEAGMRPDVVSGGSTPTLWDSHRLPGLTEVRAGTCIYNDRDIWQLDACTKQQLAYSVLATVVSTAIPGQAVVDAGSKAIAKEAFRSDGAGYGTLLDHPEVVIKGLSEEHGILDLARTDWVPRVGDRVRIVPNHVCVSVNLQDSLLALDGGEVRHVALDGRGRMPYIPTS